MEEVYGKQDARSSHATQNPGKRLPIVGTTLLIALEWLITLAPLGTGIAITKPEDLLSLFIPQASALTFGFLGAYFFAVNDVLRRYIRRDLKPKAYSSISVRILIVVILAWVISI